MPRWCTSFDKKSAGNDGNTHGNNQKLEQELHKATFKKLLKKTVYSRFKDNIWLRDLADMQLISKFNKGLRFLLYVIDVFSKYAWVVLLKDKKGANIANAFQKVLDKSKGKPNKVWVDRGSEVFNSSFKK